MCRYMLMAAAEPQVVAREIRVPEHVRAVTRIFSPSPLLRRGRHEPGAGEHHLITAVNAHVSLDQLIDIANAE